MSHFACFILLVTQNFIVARKKLIKALYEFIISVHTGTKIKPFENGSGPYAYDAMRVSSKIQGFAQPCV